VKYYIKNNLEMKILPPDSFLNKYFCRKKMSDGYNSPDCTPPNSTVEQENT
jgi:hypothetical protein